MSIQLIILIFSAFLFLGIYFFLWPKYQNFNNLKLMLKQKEIDLQNKENYFSELSQISQKLNKEYNQEISKLDLAFPISFSVFEIMLLLKKESSENGLILEKLDITPPSNIKKETLEIQEIPIKISLSGSYSSIKNFLSSLQKNARFFNIQSISLSPGKKEEKGERELFKIDLIMKVYSY